MGPRFQGFVGCGCPVLVPSCDYGRSSGSVGGRYPRGGSSLAMSGECGDGGSTTSLLAVVAGVIGLFFLRIAYEVVKRDDK